MIDALLMTQLVERLRAKNWRIATAESCTGGGIAAALTDVPGSSAWFDRGWVTYSNDSKMELLGVPAALIHEQGAVSEAVALAMAGGALACSCADVAVAVTGIAGPSGGSVEKPVGTVWVAWAMRGFDPRAQRFQFLGNRATIRAQSVEAALFGVHQLLAGIS